MNIRKVRTREDGTPVWKFEWCGPKDPATGKPRREFETKSMTEAQAKKYWHKRQTEIDAEGANYVRPSKQVLREYLAEWLEGKVARGELRATTAVTYRSLIKNHIVPALGAIAVSDLTAHAVQTFLDRMPASKVSPRTVSFARDILHGAMDDCVRLGVLAKNPVDPARSPKQTPKKVEALSLDQAEKLFAQAKTTRIGSLLEFAFFTGLRRGEVLGLRWDDIDPTFGKVKVRRSIVAVGGKTAIQPPKTTSGERTVVLPERARLALREQHKNQAADRLKAGPNWQAEGWVFATATGGPLSPTNVSRDYRRIRDAAGLPDILRFHSLRHSAASVLLAAGVPLLDVSKLMGHSRYSVTADIYAHMLPESMTEAATAVDRYLARKKVGG